MPNQLSGTWRRFTQADGLLSDKVNSVTTDGQGNVWFGTDQGISVLSPQGEWLQYQEIEGEQITYIADMITDNRDHIWAAATGVGVCRFNGATWRVFTPSNSDLPDSFVADMISDSQDNVWILSSEGLSVIYKDGVVSYIGNPFSPDPRPLFGSITINEERRVWIAAFWPPTMAEFSPTEQQWNVAGAITEHISISKQSDSEIRIDGIASDQNGHLWIVARTIIEVNGEEWYVRQPEFYPTAVYVDAKGSRWFGEKNGLLLLSPDDQWWYYRAGTILQRGSDLGAIDDISGDSQGNLWLSTSYGAIRFTPTR